MGTTLATFMKIAITVICIVALLFGAGYTMISHESKSYDNVIQSKTDSALP